MLIEASTAADYREKTNPVPVTINPVAPDPEPDPPIGVQPTADPIDYVVDSGPIKNQFYATINLDPFKAKADFADIVDEVVQQFTSKLGVEVNISVEIQAKSADGFDESLQRAVRENCGVLNFKAAEFDEE